MAVRASDRVTLAVLPSPSYVRTYYLKQSSTLNPPAVPTTNPPAAPWSTVEPTFTPNATETVYTVMLTAYGSVSFEYGPVQKSASFEAAKQAYNQAIAAGSSADAALTAAQKAQNDLLDKADKDWVLSRGTDLVTNGTGYMGNNTNFSAFTFDPTDTPEGANGSFYRLLGSATTDEIIPIDPTKKYQFSVSIRTRSESAEGRAYTGFVPLDASGLSISPHHYVYDPDSINSLASPLNKGDTTITLDRPVDTGDIWTRLPTYKYVGVWDWTAPNGRVWPVKTYTRDTPQFSSVSGNVITLSAPYSGKPRPIGTAISRNFPGGSYAYNGAINSIIPSTWTTFKSQIITGVFNGASKGPAAATTNFPQGTAGIKILLWNNSGAGVSMGFSAVSFSDASASTVIAEQATALANTAQLAANGKNINTYTDVAESTLPENVPNPPSPANRINGDRHRVRTNTKYRILAEWELTNGAWVKVKYGGATLTDLDAGTITSGYVSTTVLKAEDVAAHVGSFISLNAEQVTAGLFKSDRLDTNEIWTNDLAARVGTFSRVVVASASNYRDPGLTDPKGFDTALTYLTHDPVGGYRGGGAFIIAGSSSLRAVYEAYSASKPLSRVEGGKNLSVNVWIKSTAAIAPGTVGLATQFRTEAGNTGSVVYTHIDTSVPSNTWTKLTVGLVAPANATRIQLALRSLATHTGTVTFSDIELLPQVSGTLIEPGGIKTNHLGIVPESGTGGLELLPPGLRILPPDNGEAGTTISLRNDEPSAISFSQGGVNKFSVSEDGDMVVRSVDVTDSLKYQSQELATLLAQLPRGIIARSEATGDGWVTESESARIAMCTFEAPPEDRMIRITFECGISSFSQAYITLKQAAGNMVTNSNSIKKTWYTTSGSHGSANNLHFEAVMRAGQGGWGWPAGQTISVGGFVRSLSGTFRSHPNYGRSLTIEDVGPDVEVTEHPIYVPGSTGSDTGTSTTKYTKSWDASNFQTFPASGVRHVRANSSVVQGYIAGVTSTGHWYLPYTSIQSATSGATMNSGKLILRNEHTGPSSGMKVAVWAHNYASSPGSFGTARKIGEFHVAKGGTVEVPLTSTDINGLKSGTIKGFGVSAPNSNLEYYGYFSPRATVQLTYTK